MTEALELVERTGARLDEALLHWLRGELYLAKSASDPVAAEVSYRRALAVAQRQEAKGYELPAATSLARLWHNQGKCTEARDLLAVIE